MYGTWSVHLGDDCELETGVEDSGRVRITLRDPGAILHIWLTPDQAEQLQRLIIDAIVPFK